MTSRWGRFGLRTGIRSQIVTSPTGQSGIRRYVRHTGNAAGVAVAGDPPRAYYSGLQIIHISTRSVRCPSVATRGIALMSAAVYGSRGFIPIPDHRRSLNPAVDTVARATRHVADGGDGVWPNGGWVVDLPDHRHRNRPFRPRRHITTRRGVPRETRWRAIWQWRTGVSLQVIDITNRPVRHSSAHYDTPGAASNVAGDLAFVADGANGLQIVNITNPASPSIVGACDTPGVTLVSKWQASRLQADGGPVSRSSVPVIGQSGTRRHVRHAGVALTSRRAIWFSWRTGLVSDLTSPIRPVRHSPAATTAEVQASPWR
jgi:hypothetical protein